jgi:hypothetical protein
MPSVDPHDTLLASVRVQTVYDRKVLALLRQATRDVTRQLDGILGPNVGDVIRRDQLRAARAALLECAAALNREVGNVVLEGKIAAAVAADRELLKYDAVLMQAYQGDARIATYLKASAIRSSQEAVALAERRLQGRSYVPLSERVYHSGTVSAGLVDSVVNSALARGLSAKEFAREAAGLVNPNTPGGISYASMRLARTEINNAFHARAIDSARAKPWVEAMLWNLSGSHPTPDECNDYADGQHMSGGDPGVYPIDDVPPKPHPHCLCFVTPVEEDEDAFLDNLVAGNYDDYIDEEVAKRQAANADRVQPTAPPSPSSAKRTTPPRPAGRRVR